MQTAAAVSTISKDTFDFLEELCPGVVPAISRWAALRAAEVASGPGPANASQPTSADGDEEADTVDLSDHLRSALAEVQGDRFAEAVQDLADLLQLVREECARVHGAQLVAACRW